MGRIQCRKLHAKISRCDKYSRPSWIRHQDIDNDARWSRFAHLEWPIDLAAFNKDFETLTRILAALNVQPFPPKPDQVMRRSLFMVDGIQLPPLPPAVSTYDHPFILGRPYSDEWWECFVAASYEQAERDRPSGPFTGSIMNIGLEHLKWRLGPGLQRIVFTTIAVRADLPIRDDIIFETVYDQLPITGIIGIACTASLSHYYNRPDEDTYQWLLKIFGAPPAWFRSPFSPQAFDAMRGF
ncbi:hypothetical protein NUW54_g5074 [Trametes sanguinea]|uniref:Uncharacterized protein n=1 Tax=Trametes sanguinea TaxID=158606 RepID=A0ACC1PW50_9APHY|nr:hypothetical protein NUW54_g5074 [Trametes sanguinea]